MREREREREREGEGEPKRMKLHVIHACLPACQDICCTLSTTRVRLHQLRICMYYHLRLSISEKCLINLSVYVFVLYMCLLASPSHAVAAQCAPGVMMCKVMMCNHPLPPGGSQPLASHAPSHTLVFVACVCVSSQSGWRLLTPLFTAGRLLSFISALMTYKGTVTF